MKTLIIVLILSLLLIPELKAQTLVFSTIDKHPMVKPISDILKEAYGKIGINIEYEEYPAKRSLFYANSGEIDGELGRRKGKEIRFKNLLRVDVPLVYADVVVFTQLKHLKIDGWKCLKPYTIGILRGMECAEKGTEGMQRFVINNPHQLLKMIRFKRIDVAVIHRTFMLSNPDKNEFKDIIMKEPPLARYPVYHYLHKKNAHLFSNIEKILKDMERDGRINFIFRNFMKKICKSRN